MSEKVLAVKTAELPQSWLQQQVALSLTATEAEAILQAASPSWIVRAKAEQDTSWKQLIAYALLIDSEQRIACYPRQGSETRLHGLWSAGIGGHINPCDGNLQRMLETVKTGLIREVNEEFSHPPQLSSCTFLGMINEEESHVGQVHIGLVYLIRVDHIDRALPGEELLGLQWQSSPDLDQMEQWSSLALQLIRDRKQISTSTCRF